MTQLIVSIQPQKERKMQSNKVQPMGKSKLLSQLAEINDMPRKQVTQFLDSLTNLIAAQMSNKGSGVFILPGLLKIVKVQKPARKAGKGINPFTKEPMTIKPRAAFNVVKVRPLKKLKDMV